MKAIVEQRYGSTEVLELQDVGQPGIAKTRCCPRAGHRGGPRQLARQTDLPYPFRAPLHGRRTT